MTSPKGAQRPQLADIAALSAAAAQVCTLIEPCGPLSAAIFSSPHSGRDYPDDLLRRSRLDPHTLRASEDAFVDELFSAAPGCGAPLLAATAPRALVDLNRAPSDLDPAVIDGARAPGLNPRVAAGLGVIPRVVAEKAPIYDGKISMQEARRRIETLHAPYHAVLAALMARARARHGRATLFDCHSMPHDALKNAGRPGGRRPEIIIGDRFGASAAREVSDLAEIAFRDAGFVVARNAPFAGGHITQTYGRPARDMHAIQIEIDRGLYLDEKKVEKCAGFEATKRAITTAVEQLAALPFTGRALAAE